MRVLQILLVLTALPTALLGAPCERPVRLLFWSPEISSSNPLDNLPRVELLKCNTGVLQFQAWEPRNKRPLFVQDTNSEGIEQLVTMGNYLVFVGSGGTRDRLWVISVEDRQPKVILHQNPSSVSIETTNRTLRIAVEHGWKKTIYSYPPN